MRAFFGAVAIVAMLIAPAMAKNFAVPPKNPAMTVTFPEDWKINEIDYGFSAKDPGVWASKEEREKKQADIDAVFNSLKPIN